MKRVSYFYFFFFPLCLLGLLRCGKSCRLRWTNYLRPDIKRGDFTHEEEETIINLHQLLGNRCFFFFSSLDHINIFGNGNLSPFTNVISG